MDRAERRRRTRRIVKRRRLYLDGPWGYLIHPDEFGSGLLTYGAKDYKLEVEKYEDYLRRGIGRCRYTHPFDCGRTRCPRCSMKRWVHGKTRQELANDLSFGEQVDELI